MQWQWRSYEDTGGPWVFVGRRGGGGGLQSFSGQKIVQWQWRSYNVYFSRTELGGPLVFVGGALHFELTESPPPPPKKKKKK